MSCAMESPGGGALRYQDDGSRYPTDFVPVAASRCIIVDGTHVEQVSYGPFEALVRALRQPSEPRQALPCPLPMPLGITLTDHSGRSIVPNPPRDFCGLPLASVVAAVDALPWRNVR